MSESEVTFANPCCQKAYELGRERSVVAAVAEAVEKAQLIVEIEETKKGILADAIKDERKRAVVVCEDAVLAERKRWTEIFDTFAYGVREITAKGGGQS